MFRIVGCTIGLFLFGVIYAETINALNFFEFKVNVYLFAISIAFAFSAMDILFNYFEKRASLSSKNQGVFEKLKVYYYSFFFFLGIVLFIVVPFVWWGVIKKLATQSV